jgi:hypothetical protein
LVRNIDCLRELKVKIVGEEIVASAQPGRAVRVGWRGSSWKMERTVKAASCGQEGGVKHLDEEQGTW